MIDLHCHILPFMDDGADNGNMACAMAKHSLRFGVDTIVATPHCNLFGARGNFRGLEFEEALGLFRALLRQNGIPLTVLPGAELFAHTSNLGELLDAKKVMTLNRSRYLLVEFNFHSSDEHISLCLHRIARRGYIPVIAHPERYSAVQEDPQLVVEWMEKGYVVQLNKGSLLGRLGSRAHACGLQLLSSGLAHVIASDAHDIRHRPPGFYSLLSLLRDYCDPEYTELLIQTNPSLIIRDKKVLSPPFIKL